MSTKITHIETHPYNQGALAGRYALKDLSTSGILTNILLAVPERHRVSQNGNKLTLQRGSTVTIPNGSSEQGTVDNIYEYIFKNIEFTIPADEVAEGYMNYRFIVYDYNTKSLKWTSTQYLQTGNKYPLTFDIEDNFIYSYDNHQVSLPLGYVTKEGGEIKFVAFNTIGFFENIIWADRGVKALLPNGRNSEYKLQTYNINVSSVAYTKLDEKPQENYSLLFNSDNTFSTVSRVAYSEEFVKYQGSYYSYIANDNIICDSTGYQHNCCKAGNITIGDKSVIKSISNLNTFKMVSFTEIRDVIESDIEGAFEALKIRIDEETARIIEENKRLDEEAEANKK